MKLVQVTGPALAALLVAACGASSRHTVSAQEAAERAEQEKQAAQEQAQKARAEADKARQEATEAGRTQRQADQNAVWASQRAAQAQAQASVEATQHPGATEMQRDGRIEQMVDIEFASNSAQLSPDAKSTLDDVANKLRGSSRKHDIMVRGYTDDTGPESANDRLAQRRADSVADYLESRGLPKERIAAKGMGVRDKNDTTRGRANDRLVEIIVRPAG